MKGHAHSLVFGASPAWLRMAASPNAALSHGVAALSPCRTVHWLRHALGFERLRLASPTREPLDDFSREHEIAAQDIALMERVATGDRSALAALYDRYGGTLLALGTRVLSSRRDAEDITHDVFLEVWRRASSYDPARASVRAWLLLIMRSRSLDRRRSAGFAWTQPLSHEGEDEASHQAESQLEKDELRQALTSLSEPQREVLMLAYFEGLSSSEMAERLTLPLGTVKSRMAGALRALRGLLGDDDKTERWR